VAMAASQSSSVMAETSVSNKRGHSSQLSKDSPPKAADQILVICDTVLRYSQVQPATVKNN